MDVTALPQQLKKYRKRTGKTQVQVAKEVGVAQTTYSSWESGYRVPELRQLPALCQALGVTVDQLLSTDDLPPAGQLSNATTIPILGRIRAGIPLLAEENRIGEIAAPDRLAGRSDYALIVSGDSMSGVGIMDGDIVYMARSDRRAPGHGDIVAALVGGSDATLKWFMRRNGGWWLVAANPKYDPIPVTDDVSVQGIYLGLLMERKPRELDPPLEEMPDDLLIQRLAERRGLDPTVLEGMLKVLGQAASSHTKN